MQFFFANIGFRKIAIIGISAILIYFCFSHSLYKEHGERGEGGKEKDTDNFWSDATVQLGYREKLGQYVSRMGGVLSRLLGANETQNKENSTVITHNLTSDEVGLDNRSMKVERICSMRTCWNWKRCLSGSNLNFCTHSNSNSTDSLFITFSQLPQWVPSCDLDNTCVKIVTTPEEAIECIRKLSNVSKPTCIAVFGEASQSALFYRETKYKKNGFVSIPIAATSFPSGEFRSGFDFLLPSLHFQFGNSAQERSVQIIPAHRPILLTFSARLKKMGGVASEDPVISYLRKMSKHEQTISATANISVVLRLAETGPVLDECWSGTDGKWIGDEEDVGWYPCQNSVKLLRTSTFGLVIRTKPGINPLGWQTQLIACLANGAIPVVVGEGTLPGDEAITSSQWNKAVVRFQEARIHQLILSLQQLTDSDIVELRRQGQILFRRYFVDLKARLSSLLLAISRRLGFAPPDAPVVKGKLIYFRQPAQKRSNLTSPKEKKRITFESPGLKLKPPQNVDQVNPFWTFTSTPWDQVLPSDFTTGPHSEKYYDPALGYEYPYEEFTVILLVYDRHEIARNLVKSLNHLNYLHSVIVVHNNPNATTMNLSWPDIHVPVYVIQSPKNSLNSRFVPYDLIQTDAILCIDDDYKPDHEWILRTFRIWRSNRDRNVGYAARLHVRQAGSWAYSTDARDRYSMILTSASFFHRYYLYAYTYEMPEEIRQLVDNYTNCEDIAMNFLISHLTRKPPLQTVQKAQFTCKGCKSSLSIRPKHYAIRSQCVQRLKEIYGYMPLLYTSDQIKVSES